MAAESEISLLARSSTPTKATQKTWSSYPAEEEVDVEEEVDRPGVKSAPPESGVPSVEPRSSDTTSVQSRPSEGAPAKLILSFNASQTSVQSTDTTLEYFDAPLSKEQGGEEAPPQTEDDVVTMNIQPPAEQELAEQSPVTSAEQQPLQATEDAAGEEEEDKEEQVVEELMEQRAEDEEEVQSEEAEKQDAAAPEQADPLSYSRGRSRLNVHCCSEFQSCAGV